MQITTSRIFTPAVLLLLVVVTACSGPTRRTVDGKWDVSENVCSSNPDNPELGDMRSEIRQHFSGTAGERKISFFHLDRTIVVLEERFNYRSRTGTINFHENSAANPVTETRKTKNNREVNAGLKQGVSDFFKNDPDIDGEEATSGCLYRGQ